jgi:TubC N-terminal docking domain
MDRPLTDDPAAVVFLAALQRQGFELQADRDRLRIRPSDRLNAALTADLQRYKPALLVLLAPAPEVVTLKGNVTVPLPALQLIWSLEDRGFDLSLDEDEGLTILPIDQLTETDRAGLHRWRRELATIVAYACPPDLFPY